MFLKCMAIVACLLLVSASPPTSKKNMVMIYIDDFRTDINVAYGRSASVTPNMDRLAMSQGTVVMGRAYSNYPMCSPSRISTLYGRLPSHSGVMTNLDEGDTSTVPMSNPSLPKYLQSQGYYTATGGKVFHEEGINGDNCWNNTYEPTIKQTSSWCRQDKLAMPVFYTGTRTRVTPQICITTTPLSDLRDIVLARKAASTLETIVKRKFFPFFLSVGFYKPHVPLQIHRDYWNMMSRIPDVENDAPPGPMQSYVHPDLTFSEDNNRVYAVKSSVADLHPFAAPASKFRPYMRQAYAAGVAQSDHGVGIVLDAIDKLNLVSNTLVVLLSDHGYYLGEQNLWAKNSLFELALRVPLMFRAPWLVKTPRPKGVVARLNSQLFDLVDLYKTSVSMLGLGKGLAPDLDGIDQSATISRAISLGSDPRPNGLAHGSTVAVVARCGQYDGCVANNVNVTAIGFTYRDRNWRYTVWMRAMPNRTVDWSNAEANKITEELYSHANDNVTIFNYCGQVSYFTETYNYAPERPSSAARLFKLLQQAFANSTSS